MSDRTSSPILLTEGDVGIVYTITVKRAGSVVDLTSYAAVWMYAHDQDQVKGTNQIDGATCTVTDAVNGICTFTTTAAHATITGGDSLKGTWRVLLDVEGDKSGTVEWSDAETFEIEKNEMVA